MCLPTKQQRPIKIKKDLTVYKLVKISSNKKLVRSEMQNFLYEIGIKYESEISISKRVLILYDDKLINAMGFDGILPMEKEEIAERENWSFIDIGFHSALKPSRFEDGLEYWKNYPVDVKAAVAECTVPKGSLIYKGPTGLIVSNQIIINKILED